MRRTLILLCLSPLGLVACHHGKKPTTAATAANNTGRPDDKGKIRRELDLNHDGVPDMWKIYAKGADGAEVIVRKEMDINYDGKVDIYNYYDEKEILVKDEI